MYLALAGGVGVRVVRVTAARVARSEDFRIFRREEGEEEEEGRTE